MECGTVPVMFYLFINLKVTVWRNPLETGFSPTLRNLPFLIDKKKTLIK